MDPELLIRFLSTEQARRPKVIFNCLTGKRTVSVLFWALQYDLLTWLNVWPSLSWDSFEAAVNTLVKAKRVDVQSDGQLLSHETVGSPYLNTIVPVSQRRLYRMMHAKIVSDVTLLGIQALSHRVQHDMSYFPVSVSERARQQVRRWFKSFDEVQAQQLVEQFQQWLETLPNQQAQIFVSQLVGAHHSGYTTMQLSQALGTPAWQIDLMQTANLAAFSQFCQQSDSAWQQLLMPFFEPDLPKPVQQTLAATLRHQNREKIGEERGLKPSTINEHLLTAAILLPIDKFPFDLCVNAGERARIAAGQPREIGAWQCGANASADQFFKFRMTQIWETKQHES
ncbi:MAG TPA: hypothetical protein DCW31_02640 [Lactobacillus sp.]|nr:hypothetical protein [Lactobacillus sp.]